MASDFNFTTVGTKSGRTVTATGSPSPPGGQDYNAVVITLSGTTLPSPGAAVTFDAFCVDLLDTIPTGSVNLNYHFGGPGDLVPPISSAQANDVRRLAGLYFADPNAFGQNARAAMQMAIWSVIYPTLTFSSGTAEVNTLAAGYLANLGTTPIDWNVRFLISDSGSQDLIVWAPVPEPATWGMLIVGFGLVGLGLRRRQRDGIASATA
ncbi:MAG: PEPxxWA-CTERM sorting domain-containing protein [Thermaurantiacus sp.]